MLRFAVVVALLGLAGCKADKAKCEKALRNYASLVFYDNAEKNIALLPKEKQEAARAKLKEQFDLEVEARLDEYMGSCVSANNDKMIDCMIAAKTGAQAIKCAPPATNKE